MATTAQSIILDAQTALQDLAGVRWSATELVRHLNRGQRDIQTVRPDTTAVLATLALVAGFKQTIPVAAASLIDIPANTSGTRITKVDTVLLDATLASWRSATAAATVVHFMHDMRLPRQFLVYPPATTSASVDIEYSAYPTDVTTPSGDGLAYTTVSGNISLNDQWSTALLCVVLHYAYAKDAEYGGNAGLSQAYMQKAQGILGVELQSATQVAPKS
jgi:hypothetical protein